MFFIGYSTCPRSGLSVISFSGCLPEKLLLTEGGSGGQLELNYRTSLKGFSFIFSKESLKQTDMSLLGELETTLFEKESPATYVFMPVWLRDSF